MFSGRNRGNKENSGADDSQKVYVLVIYTGGTIGMKESPDGMQLNFSNRNQLAIIRSSRNFFRF